MGTGTTTAEIDDRFSTEQRYIQQYVDFLEDRSYIRAHEIAKLNRILEERRLPRLWTPMEWHHAEHHYGLDDMAQLLRSVSEARPAITHAISAQEERLRTMVRPPDLRNGPALLGEWIDFILSAIDDAPSQEDINRIRKLGIEQQEEAVRESGDETAGLDASLIDHAIQTALWIAAQQKLADLEFVRDSLAELTLLARAADPGTEVNVLRQGFILLMTAFDAAVFDLVRIALKDNFFQLIAAFGRQDKVPLERLGNFLNFESFRDQVIEEQLKARYLKDLLFLLDGLGVRCVDETAGDRFVQLIELVLRRNVHIHNHGVVDERYLERDQHGRPRFNIYNLGQGEVAVIEEPYWKTANRLCQTCVSKLTAWIELGATPGKRAATPSG